MTFEHDAETNTARRPLRLAPCLSLECRYLNPHSPDGRTPTTCARCGGPVLGAMPLRRRGLGYEGEEVGQ